MAYSSNWFTHLSKSPFPSYFSGLRLNFFNSTHRCSSSSPPRASAPRHGGDMAGVEALKSNRRVASFTAVSALTPFSSLFSTEEYLGICIHACGHPRSAWRRSNTVATSVTTVPQSVCYGALNLLVHVDASNFVPYACDRAVTGGECEGPEVPHRRPLFPVVAWQQKSRTVLQGLSHLCFPSLGWSKCWDPSLLYVLSFYNRFPH